jgi:hypothetical protein
MGAAMSILQAVAAVGGLYLFLHLYLIPKLHRSLPEARSDNAYSAIVGLLVAEVLRGAALVIGASLTIIGATIWAMSYFSGFGSQDDLARIFESLRWTHNLVEEVSTWWGILTVALLSLALWIAIRREARQRVDTGFANAFEKLKADAEADSLPDIPSTPEMATIENMIEQRRTKVTRILEELNAQGESESKGDPEKSDELTELLAQIESLKTKLINIDVLRRLEVGKAVASDAKIDEKSAKNNLFLSTGFFNLISGTTRVLAIISLALLAPSLVAISSSIVLDSLSESQRAHGFHG